MPTTTILIVLLIILATTQLSSGTFLRLEKCASNESWKHDRRVSVVLQTQVPPSHNPLQSSSSSPLATTLSVRIRDPNYGEMGPVADIIMHCFYKDAKAPAKQLYQLGELNRVQQNFPYDRERHRMFVAIAANAADTNDSNGGGGSSSKKHQLVGFCDIDARKPNRPTSYKYNPRPYLSDLCVETDFRRLGVAQQLVERGEKLCLEWKLQEIYVRVERTNEAARRLYTKLGYKEHTHPLETSEKTMLLRKDLFLPGGEDTKEG